MLPDRARAVFKHLAKGVLVAAAAFAAMSAQAQTRHRHEPREVERPVTAPSIDRRDTLVPAPSPFQGRPYWLALAQCGGIYFKLNVLYTDVAVHARAVKPDPKINAEYTKKLNEAIATATAFFDGAEHFLMGERGIERTDAVLVYDGLAQAAGDKVRSIDAGLAAAASCPALYRACRRAYAKYCGEPLAPTS